MAVAVDAKRQARGPARQRGARRGNTSETLFSFFVTSLPN